jgi:hypothetical protein
MPILYLFVGMIKIVFFKNNQGYLVKGKSQGFFAPGIFFIPPWIKIV